MNEIEFKKSIVRDKLAKIYEECGRDYIKYVEKVEELEKKGILKTEYIPRDKVNTIWSQTK